MKKTLNILKSIGVWLVVAFAVCMMLFTVVSVNTFDRKDRSIFGYKMFIVLTDSMSAVKEEPDHGGYFDAGDLVLAKVVDPSTLQPGDIITFQSTNSDSYGQIITHMIREVTTDAEGRPGFITYGTKTGVNDESVVIHDYVMGKYQVHFPNVGHFFAFLKTTPGYIICIFMPFLLLILVQGVNSIRLFRTYKKEQQDALQAEKDKIEADRAETQRMMAELLELKAKMQGGGETAEAPPAVENEESSGEQSSANT